MAPKMRGSISDAAKAKAQVAVEANKKEIKEEKKMFALQQCLKRIRKVKLDEHIWAKYCVEIREWEKSENARNIMTAIIKSYLNAPIIDSFGTLKEEAAKFLVSRYHDRNIWLDQPIAIIEKIINLITDLPLNGNHIPVGSNNPALLEKFIGITQKGKNSKGLQINSIQLPWVKWTALIISIFLTIYGWLSNIKLDMLEAIEGVSNHAKTYS